MLFSRVSEESNCLLIYIKYTNKSLKKKTKTNQHSEGGREGHFHDQQDFLEITASTDY